MQDLTNIIQNSALAPIAKGASKSVLNAIGQAAAKTGVDFAYLVQQAQAESNFNPTVKAKTSSATGLFQFIKSTWMNMIDQYGAKHGIDTKNMSRDDILNLRKDPKIASVMAAEFAGENEKFLNTHWGGEVGATELYFAHFLGAGGAASFLNARDENPHQPAAVIFPKAAKANHNVFYDKNTGRARSLDEVYGFFDQKFKVKSMDTPTQLAELDETTTHNRGNKGGIYSDDIQSLIFTRPRQNYASGIPNFQLVQHPVELMILSQLDLPGFENKNSVF